VSLEKAPYFSAFVASSLRAMPSTKVALGGKRIALPLIAIRFARPPVPTNGVEELTTL